MPEGVPFTDEEKAHFLEVLAEAGVINDACRATKIDRKTVYNWRQNDPAFAEAFERAMEQATDLLEAEARRRAIQGTPEPLTCKDGLIYDRQGNPVTVQRYSDTLMGLMLRAHRPDKFRDKATVEVNLGGLSDQIAEARKRARQE